MRLTQEFKDLIPRITEFKYGDQFTKNWCTKWFKELVIIAEQDEIDEVIQYYPYIHLIRTGNEMDMISLYAYLLHKTLNGNLKSKFFKQQEFFLDQQVYMNPGSDISKLLNYFNESNSIKIAIFLSTIVTKINIWKLKFELLVL